MPLFHWGALFKQVDLEKSATKQAAYAYQKAVLNAAAEVKNAMISVSEQIAQTRTNEQALNKMRNISAIDSEESDRILGIESDIDDLFDDD